MDTFKNANTELEKSAGPAPAAARRGTTRAQRLKYLADWEASGLSAEAFAAGKPIKANSLYQWRSKEKSGKRSGPRAEARGFKELKLADLSVGRSGRPEATLRSGGVELSISGCDISALLPDLLGFLRSEAADV